MKTSLKERELFHIGVTDESERDVLEYVLSSLKNSSKKLSIFTPNPEIIVRADRDHTYRDVLNSGSVLLPDGAGLIFSSWILGNPLMHRITGVDFMYKLVGNIALSDLAKHITVGFLGAKPDVALRTAECLQKVFPTLRVSFIGEEWESGVFIPENLQLKIAESGFVNQKKLEKAISEQESGKVVDLKQESRSMNHDNQKKRQSIDILFVAFGAPRQETWIHSNLANIPVRVAMGVGGSFDYISGQVSRAPFLLRLVGLEWLYRLVRQPWRWRRQLALITFVGIVVKEWVRLLRSTLLSRKKTA